MYLIHWGIPGMKWGVRRFKNSDGTLTDEGKIRYGRREDGKLSRACGRGARLAVGLLATYGAYNLTNGILKKYSATVSSEINKLLLLKEIGLDEVYKSRAEWSKFTINGG